MDFIDDIEPDVIDESKEAKDETKFLGDDEAVEKADKYADDIQEKAD